mmetsp:Transcript_97701/g.248266  ORF Transcript_97701/g.248266 Transcript_97701/m.248266 type:complete len:237 (-) Transcript_97701:324-1034(-)
MATESNIGRMAPPSRVSGCRIAPPAMAASHTTTEMSSSASGLLTWLAAMETTTTQAAPATEVNGPTICRRALASKAGWTSPDTKVSSEVARRRILVATIGLMAHPSRGHGVRMSWRGQASMMQAMAGVSKASGRRARSTASGTTLGPGVAASEGSTPGTRSGVSVYLCGPTAGATRAIGWTAGSMAQGATPRRMARRAWRCGKRARNFTTAATLEGRGCGRGVWRSHPHGKKYLSL